MCCLNIGTSLKFNVLNNLEVKLGKQCNTYTTIIYWLYIYIFIYIYIYIYITNINEYYACNIIVYFGLFTFIFTLMCGFVCLYVYIWPYHVSICNCVFEYIWICACLYVCVRACVCMCICIYICVYMYAFVYVWMYAYVYLWLWILFKLCRVNKYYNYSFIYINATLY